MTIAPAEPALVSSQYAERLLARACGGAPHLRGQISTPQFLEALERSARGYCKTQARVSAAELERYLESLHLADLALACACMAGNETAWEYFVRNYRPELYGAARAVARDANPHELADSIYAELFGVDAQGRERASLFRYFHGRSKLSTWLRSIVAQRFVDYVRAQKRVASLDDEVEESGSEGALLQGHKSGPTTQGHDPERAGLLDAMQRAVEGAIARLDARDRLRLSYYYVQDLTLAQIGRLLGESEATTSRKLERTRGELRKGIEIALREGGLSAAQIALCFDYAREEWPFDLRESLAQRAGGEKLTAPNPKPGSTGET